MTAPQTRITIDIDSHVQTPRLRLLRAVTGLQREGAYHTHVATSTSGTGFHVVGFFEERIAVQRQLDIRRNLNDDPNRIRMDEQRAERGLPINTMWTNKAGNDGERIKFDTVDDAIAYSRTQATTHHERMGEIANDGHKAIVDQITPKMSHIEGI